MKKGFTIVELLGVIVVLGIVSGLVVVSINFLIQRGKNGVYSDFETNLKGAMENYLIENIDEVPSIGGSITKTLDELVSSGFSDPIKDPNGGSCSGGVVVSRANDLDGNYNLSYSVCLICVSKSNKVIYTSQSC